MMEASKNIIAAANTVLGSGKPEVAGKEEQEEMKGDAAGKGPEGAAQQKDAQPGNDMERLEKAKSVLKPHLPKNKHKMLKDAKSWEVISESLSSLERNDVLTLVKNCGVTLTPSQERRMNRGVVVEQLNEQIFLIGVDHGPESSRRE